MRPRYGRDHGSVPRSDPATAWHPVTMLVPATKQGHGRVTLLWSPN